MDEFYNQKSAILPSQVIALLKESNIVYFVI
jgi:hypothetical protein